MPWHFIFETLAYVVAFRLYSQARQASGDFLDYATRWQVIVAAMAGAAIGSRLLFYLEDPALTRQHWTEIGYWLSGKTIVGALLGGTLAVEWAKGRLGVRRRTGDLFAIPLAIGIAMGRVGCFLAGKADATYGVATSLPWAVDLGDGIRRHPVQLYEVIAMLLLAGLLARIKPPRYAEGDRYRVFLFTYLAWRLAIDFLKPGLRFAGLTTLQWACAAAVCWYGKDMARVFVHALGPDKVVVHG